MKQSRFRSKLMWSAVIAQILVILQLTGVIEQLGLDVGALNNIITAGLQIFSLIGILNDPTNADGF